MVIIQVVNLTVLLASVAAKLAAIIGRLQRRAPQCAILSIGLGRTLVMAAMNASLDTHNERRQLLFIGLYCAIHTRQPHWPKKRQKCRLLTPWPAQVFHPLTLRPSSKVSAPR